MREAQKSIAEWSDTILNIAQLRGSQGRLSDAVEAAKLVPSGTAAHANAQKAIATWKGKPPNSEKRLTIFRRQFPIFSHLSPYPFPVRKEGEIFPFFFSPLPL